MVKYNRETGTITENSMKEMRDYMGVTSGEFMRFWWTLSELEKYNFKNADLSK